MAGYTIERRNYIKLINDDTYDNVDAMPPNDMSQRGLASKLFKEMLDHGFKLIWTDVAPSNNPTDTTDLWKAKQVVFEPTTDVDPLSPSLGGVGSTAVVAKPQGWRVGFVVDGFENNQLIAYLGTAKTMGVDGIKTEYSYPVVLVQGGATQGEGRIGVFNEHSFRISITKRGFAILVWAARYIESMNNMGLLCVQRPVKFDGTPVIDGYAPVFALHNTDPVGYSRPVQTDRFFRTLVREKDAELPTMASLISLASNRYATGTITFNSLALNKKDSTDTSDPKAPQIVVNFNINGAQIQIGAPDEGDTTRGILPVPHVNNKFVTAKIGQTRSAVELCDDFMTAINASTDYRLRDLTFIQDRSRALVHIISKVPGNVDISYGVTVTPNKTTSVEDNWVPPIMSPAGTLGGGGKGWKPYTGKLRLGYGGTSGSTPAPIVPGTDAFQMGSVSVSFSTSASPSSPLGTAVIAVPSGGTYSTNQFNSLVADNIITWINSNRSKYPEFNGLEVTKTGSGSDPSLWTELLFSKDPRKTDASNANDFTLTGSTANLSVTGVTGGKLTGGATNQAYGNIVFSSLPTNGSWIEFNGVRFTFVDNPYAGFREISTVVDNSDPEWLSKFVDRIATVVRSDTSVDVQKASYTASGTTLKIVYKEPGYIGNSFTLLVGLFPTGAAPSFPQGFTLIGGCGSASADGSTGSNTPDDVSELTGRYGTTMYRVPNVWEGPVTTDTGEYVLLFPFGLCSGKVAFTEEMDMVAISKGAAYQGIQDVSINVYNQARTYTSYNSNLTTQKDYVRVFLLTGGGDI